MTDRPEPMTPPDCDLRGHDWMRLSCDRLFHSSWYFAALKDGRGGLGSLKLWWVAMLQVPAGSLPNDEEELCFLADFGQDMKAWRKHRATAMYGFKLCSDNRWYHPVIAEEVVRAYNCKLKARQDRQADNERLRRWRAGKQNGQDPPETPDETRFSTRFETPDETHSETPDDTRRETRMTVQDSTRQESKKEPSRSPPTQREGAPHSGDPNADEEMLTPKLTPRQAGTNPRAAGTNPRATAGNPRKTATNPRAKGDFSHIRNGFIASILRDLENGTYGPKQTGNSPMDPIAWLAHSD